MVSSLIGFCSGVPMVEVAMAAESVGVEGSIA